MSIIATTGNSAAVTLAPIWRDVLATSLRALTEVVAEVRTDQGELATPCAEWTVTQVIQHAAGDQLAFARALGVGAGPAYDPFAPSGVLDVPATGLVAAAAADSAAAWATVADDAETVPTPLPHGDLPTPIAAVLCALDAAVHAWDIAVTIGRPSPLTEDLAAALLLAADGVIEPLRQWGAYAPVVAGESGDTAVEHLLRYLGRTPRR
ncbi:TIGR03086 family metal-binding protein [Nocardia sp. BMG111209]|uniref:TIGR03086 family metal-binding protein n=1 Tax=Nocardia sp. BMG111209 TaxID=1160137 RepID=UPI0003764A28|nr:TIGR03086 family metal-binding protein [Nocardia sp. BMG111209]